MTQESQNLAVGGRVRLPLDDNVTGKGIREIEKALVAALPFPVSPELARVVAHVAAAIGASLIIEKSPFFKVDSRIEHGTAALVNQVQAIMELFGRYEGLSLDELRRVIDAADQATVDVMKEIIAQRNLARAASRVAGTNSVN